MAQTTIDIDNLLLEQVKQAAGEDLSKWVATACRARLLTDAARQHARWARDHPEEAAAERARDAVAAMETEAGREVEHLAEQAALQRDPTAEPTEADYINAARTVRDLLDAKVREFDQRDDDSNS